MVCPLCATDARFELRDAMGAVGERVSQPGTRQRNGAAYAIAKEVCVAVFWRRVHLGSGAALDVC